MAKKKIPTLQIVGLKAGSYSYKGLRFDTKTADQVLLKKLKDAGADFVEQVPAPNKKD